MPWRDNWLLALPPAARLIPPLLLAALGGLALVWLHDRAPENIDANLTPLVWCAIGAGLLVRPAQPLVVAAAALGMAGLALHGVWLLVQTIPAQDWSFAHTLRTAFWGLVCLLALPAAVGEALAAHTIAARRLYFGAVAVFFVEQGLRRLLGVTGRPSEALFLFLIALVALFAVWAAERTLSGPLLAEETPALPPRDRDEPLFLPRPVRYLDETPSR